MAFVSLIILTLTYVTFFNVDLEFATQLLAASRERVDFCKYCRFYCVFKYLVSVNLVEIL